MLSRTRMLVSSDQKYRAGQTLRKTHLDVWLRGMYERHFGELFNHATFGYSLRVASVAALFAVSFLTGRRLLYWSEEDRPLATRRFQRWVPVTFIDRTREGDTDMFVYRFALPNAFDYTGHSCFSSVQINLFNKIWEPTRRYYTPINHPEQRGIVEFGIKHHTPGEMTTVLKNFQPGATIYLGGWLKEFEYKANEYDEFGFIAAHSGVTPFLQLLTCALANPEDKTKFSLLYANDSVEQIPFRKKLEAVRDRFPDRFKLTHIVTKNANGEPEKLPRASEAMAQLGRPLSLVAPTLATSATSALITGQLTGNVLVYDDSLREIAVYGNRSKRADFVGGYQGFVDRDMILETMPWPGKERTKICICGPPQFLGNLCGRSVHLLRFTYIQGLYDGIMRQMGYTRGQIYKFGYSFHTLGYDE